LAALNIDPAGSLADFSAAYLLRDAEAKQPVLDELDVRERLRIVDEALTRELVTLELGDRIQEEIRERIEEQQKEFFLRADQDHSSRARRRKGADRGRSRSVPATARRRGLSRGGRSQGAR